MTWDELKEKAKEMGYKGHENVEWSGLYTRVGDDNIVTFYKDGHIEINNELLMSDRTPEQMLMIMRGLE